MRNIEKTLIAVLILLNLFWVGTVSVVHWLQSRREPQRIIVVAPAQVAAETPTENNPQVPGLDANAGESAKRQRLIALWTEQPVAGRK